MAKKPEKTVEPISDGTFDEVSRALVTDGPSINRTTPTPLPPFELPDEVPVAVVAAPMTIGGVEVDCAVLGDETRVISDRGVSRAMGTKRGGSHWKRQKEDGALTLPPYLSAQNLQEFIPNDLRYILTHPIKYRAKKSGAIANGLLATAFPKVLRVWERAYDAGKLRPVQRHIGEQAKRLLEGMDEIAIIALIDEATGYQEIRRHDELQQILSAYVLPEHRPYLQSVPKEFFDELFRVYGWERRSDNRGPRYAGKLLRQLIYEQLPEPVLPALDDVNPTNPKYQRKRKHFQHLTPEIGKNHLQTQLAGVMALLRASPSNNPAAFKALFRRSYGAQLEFDLGED